MTVPSPIRITHTAERAKLRARFPSYHFGLAPFDIVPPDAVPIVHHGANAFTQATGTRLFEFRVPAGYVAVINRFWAYPTDRVTYTMKIRGDAVPTLMEIGHYRRVEGAYSPPGSTQTLTLQQGVDSYTGASDSDIRQGNPHLASPNDPLLYLDFRVPQCKHGLFRFDIGDVPADDEIVSATLRIWKQWSAGSDTWTFDISALKRDTYQDSAWFAWTTWENYTLDYGPPPVLVPWQTAGGKGALDKYAAQSTVDVNPAASYLDLDVTDIVSDFHDGSKSNLGIIVYPQVGFSMSPPAYQFRSSEHATTANRPRLTIEHRVPAGSADTPVHLKDRMFGYAPFGVDRACRGSFLFDPILIGGPRHVDMWVVNFSLTLSDASAGVVGYLTRRVPGLMQGNI